MTETQNPHDRIFDMLTSSNDVTWQSIIMDVVKGEGMDPWDLDVGVITNRYIEALKKLKEMDFRVSGKVLLASAILLKIKSNKLVGEDLAALDSLFAQGEEIDEQGFYNDLEQEMYMTAQENAKNMTEQQKYKLIPRTPQARKRKVSIYDLVHALEKALEVKRRRVMADIPESKITLPKNTTDITVIIKQIYAKILKFFYNNNKSDHVTFKNLLNGESREAKIQTFIPLLHLTNERKIDLHQEEPFGEIKVELINRKKDLAEELGETS